jgi:hypothetical protein
MDKEYNYRRPHEALNNLTPDEWKKKQEITEIHKLNPVLKGVLTPEPPVRKYFLFNNGI